MKGKLYVVATPIGNLGDISARAVETLRCVDFIAAEDTRVSAKLLNRFQIKTPQMSYFEHNRRQKGEMIVSRLAGGESCALITDAGTPAISDPGSDLVAMCHEAEIEVVAIPGPSAAIAALSICGMDSGRFTFEGFLSTNNKSRRQHLESLRAETRTMVFYEAPHKLAATLEDMLTYLGDRPVALCREITKLHETVIRTTLGAARVRYQTEAPRGEFVLVVAGGDAEPKDAEPSDLLGEVKALIDDGLSLTDAVKTVSRLRSAPRNPLYKQALERFKQ